MRFTSNDRDEMDVKADVACKEVDLHIEQRYRCDGLPGGESLFSCDPATADRIASALHVAAAQVRKARGEVIEPSSVEDDMVLGVVIVRDESGAGAVFSSSDVPRLIAELGAWLASHQDVAK